MAHLSKKEMEGGEEEGEGKGKVDEEEEDGEEGDREEEEEVDKGGEGEVVALGLLGDDYRPFILLSI